MNPTVSKTVGGIVPQKDIEQRRAYQREYQRKWRAEHPKKAREIIKKSVALHREERAAVRRKRYAENLEEARARSRDKRDPEKAREYYLANRERVLATGRAYRKNFPEKQKERSRRWFEANRDRKMALNKAWCAANKEKIDARRKERNWALKHAVWAQYGGSICSCCGTREQEFLTVDHINGGGGKHRVALRQAGSANIYRWLVEQQFPAGYRVLCMNCNWAIGLHGYCPHQRRNP